MFVATVLLTLASPAWCDGRDPETWVPQDPLAEGQRILEAKRCNSCHSVAGEIGPKKSAPALGRQRAWQDVMQLAGSWWNHAPAMSQMMAANSIERPKLTADEASKLISYLFYLKFLDDPGDSQRGKALFEDRSCALCHQLGGQGGTSGPRLDELKGFASPLFLTQALWNHGPGMLAKMQELGAQRPRFEGEDVADLAAFLNGGEPASVGSQAGSPRIGQQVFRARGCQECHAIRGEGGHEGPDLGTQSRLVNVSQMASALWNHGPVMWAHMAELGIAFPVLSDRDMADLLAYLSFVQYMAADGDAARGAKVYQDKTCETCHAAGATGTNRGPTLIAAPALDTPFHWTAAIWNHASSVEQALRDSKTEWPRFEGDEMRDLYAYLKSLGGVKR